jgi:hypothetical protein
MFPDCKIPKIVFSLPDDGEEGEEIIATCSENFKAFYSSYFMNWKIREAYLDGRASGKLGFLDFVQRMAM